MTCVPPELAANRTVSLPELLTSRECRQARQQAWQAQHASTLLVLTLVVPGAVKDSALTRNIFNLGWQALQQMGHEQNWHCLQAEALALSTGCEGFMALQADAQRVKDCAMQLEVQQPIGRLWDIDVLDPEGRIFIAPRSGAGGAPLPAVQPAGQNLRPSAATQQRTAAAGNGKDAQ